LGKVAARTALPQPPKTSQNVPTNSATERFGNENCIVNSFLCDWLNKSGLIGVSKGSTGTFSALRLSAYDKIPVWQLEFI
jgi:hypothetical protein